MEFKELIKIIDNKKDKANLISLSVIIRADSGISVKFIEMKDFSDVEYIDFENDIELIEWLTH